MTDYAAQRRAMVESQIRPTDVTNLPLIKALLEVPREEFVPPSHRAVAYADEEIPLAPGRWMLTPRNFAKMIDALDIRDNELVLDIGCGLGYSSVVISRLAEAVVGVEEIEPLVKEAEELVARHADNVAIVEAPLAKGAPEHGPYDVIVIEGAAECLPDAIVGQLKEGGRIGWFHVEEGGAGECRIGFRHGDDIDWRFAFNGTAPLLPGFARTPEFEF